MVAEQTNGEAARGELLSKMGELQKRLASVVSQNSGVDDLRLQARDFSSENPELRDQFEKAVDELAEWQAWHDENQESIESLDM
eukprot:2275676-Alexandrium_andersonii.AAC.1